MRRFTVDEVVNFSLCFVNPALFFIVYGDVVCLFVALLMGSFWAFNAGTEIDHVVSEFDVTEYDYE